MRTPGSDPRSPDENVSLREVLIKLTETSLPGSRVQAHFIYPWAEGLARVLSGRMGWDIQQETLKKKELSQIFKKSFNVVVNANQSFPLLKTSKGEMVEDPETREEKEEFMQADRMDIKDEMIDWWKVNVDPIEAEQARSYDRELIDIAQRSRLRDRQVGSYTRAPEESGNMVESVIRSYVRSYLRLWSR